MQTTPVNSVPHWEQVRWEFPGDESAFRASALHASGNTDDLTSAEDGLQCLHRRRCAKLRPDTPGHKSDCNGSLRPRRNAFSCSYAGFSNSCPH